MIYLKKDHEKKKYQTKKEKEDEIIKLRTELEQYKLLSRLADINEIRDRKSEYKGQIPPIFERQTERRTVRKVSRKKKRKGKRSVSKAKKDPFLKFKRSLTKSLNKYLRV